MAKLRYREKMFVRYSALAGFSVSCN